MGIFGAMLTAVSGLRSQSYSLENISGNIANSQTTGFKRVDTSFIDLFSDLPFRQERSGSVAAFSRLTNTIQGDLQPTGVATNMAINGQGFFVVQERTGSANGRPVFGGVDLYSRRGDFSIDKDGYLVNGAGFFLKGSTFDPVTGELRGSDSSIIQLSNEPIPASTTTTINYRANLPATPATASQDDTVANSELFAAPPAAPAPPAPAFPAGYDPRITSLPAPAGAGFVVGSDQTRFLSQSIPGGSVTVYDTLGNPVDVQMRWAKVDNTAGNDTWNLFYLENSNATNNTVAWRNAGVPVTFGSNGQLTSPATNSLTLANLTVNGRTVGTMSMEFGAGGLTQYAASSGLVQQSMVQQDGYPAGTLDSVSVLGDGRVVGNYSNGRVSAIAQVAIAQFNADNSLKRRDSGAYEQTLESGIPILGLNGSSIVGGNVENSNTDIAEEFSKMILTQQAYSANTRVVSTSQQMIADALNMVRG